MNPRRDPSSGDSTRRRVRFEQQVHDEESGPKRVTTAGGPGETSGTRLADSTEHVVPDAERQAGGREPVDADAGRLQGVLQHKSRAGLPSRTVTRYNDGNSPDAAVDQELINQNHPQIP